MRQIDEATSVGEADDVPQDEMALLAPKIKPTPAVPTLEAAMPAPAPVSSLPGIQPAPATPPPPPAPTLSGLTPSGKDPRTEWVQQQQAMYKPDYSGAAPAGGVPAIPASTTPAYAPLSATPAAPAQSATWTNAQGQGQSGAISDVPAGTPFYAGSGQAMDTLSGSWAAPTAAPSSAPLIPTTAGGTMTPQGDAGNAFRGYVSDQGGTFGQADTGDRSQALRALESISGINSGTTYQNGVYGGGDPTKFGLPATATSADITALSKQNGLIANGDPAAIKAGLTSTNPWLKANAEREAAKHPELLVDNATGRLAGNSTAKDPAQQAAMLASGATAASTGQAPPAPAGTLPGVATPPTGSPAPRFDPNTTTIGSQVASPETATFKPNGIQTTSAPASPTPASPSAGGLPGVSAAPSGAFTATNTDPNDSLINKTLDYGPLTDRFKVAQSELENWNKTSDPQFQADLRDAMRKAAAGGALGSGMLQTSLGDITQNRELQRQGMGTSFLNNALTGSIQDAKDRANFAAGQQGFQAGQQQTAFGQGVTEAQLNEALTNGSFQRALQTLLAGSNGNPADIQLALSQIFGNQGANASNALSGLIQGKTANSGATSSGGYLADLLKQILGGGGASAPDSTVVYGGQ